jgi:uncharacterized membrane protein YeaQ/YmgE (transglycosylase-associated protein family)
MSSYDAGYNLGAALGPIILFGVLAGIAGYYKQKNKTFLGWLGNIAAGVFGVFLVFAVMFWIYKLGKSL